MTQEPKFFDAHTHVQFNGYDGPAGDNGAERDAVLARAREAGVWMINVGTQIDTSRAAVELAEHEQAAAQRDGRGESGVFAAIGLHPVHTSRSHHDENELGGGDAAKTFTSRGEAFDVEAYRRLALHERTVAIGECGLDYFHLNDAESSDVEPRDVQIRKQKEAFIAQVELSLEVKKPLMIHCRNAFADLIEIVKSYEKKFDTAAAAGHQPGAVHFFTGSPDDASALLDLGFSFTFGGAITFPPRKGKTVGDYDEVIKLIPSDRILSETDAPYVAPLKYRSKRNEPAYVVETVKKLAELKGVTADEMKKQIWENARKVFNLN
jgi:TatD DNase family protein